MSDVLMEEKVRIYHVNYEDKTKPNYYAGFGMNRRMPAFGATKEESPVMTREEACNITRDWSMFVDWELEHAE